MQAGSGRHSPKVLARCLAVYNMKDIDEEGCRSFVNLLMCMVASLPQEIFDEQGMREDSKFVLVVELNR